MIETKYFGINLIDHYIKKGVLPKDVDTNESILIGTVIDILYFTEELKINSNLESNFCDKISDLNNMGVYFQGLGKNELEENLFYFTDGGEFRISEYANNTKVSPYFSANQVSLKPTIRSHWDEDFFESISY